MSAEIVSKPSEPPPSATDPREASGRADGAVQSEHGPSERLRLAADALEAAAAKATPGPWQPEYALASHHVQAVFVDCDGDDCDHDRFAHADGTCAIGSFEADGDNRWVILANPELATPLAALLRDAAETCEWQAYGLPLAVADVILRSAQ